MSKEAKILASIAAVCIGLVVWRYSVQSAPQSNLELEETTVTDQPATSVGADSSDSKTPVSSALTRPKVPKQDAAAIAAREKSFSFSVPKNLSQEQQELESLSRYTQALYLFASNDQKPEQLVQKLTDAGLKPLVVQDFNDFTGKMIIVRTDETLPGTRYFHAQYFEDENKKPFLQHMSFEFRPGEKSLEEAVDYVRKAFPKSIGAPQYCKKNYAAWEYGEMTAWCHQFDEEDVARDDATRARSKDDVGAVKCAIEQNPHPHEDLCG